MRLHRILGTMLVLQLAVGCGGSSSNGGAGLDAARTGGATGGDAAVTTCSGFSTLAGGYVNSGALHGYAWTAKDTSATTTITPADFSSLTAGSALCASGSVAHTPTFSGWAEIGISINQASGGASAGTYIPTTSGINVHLTNPGASQLRIVLYGPNAATDPNNSWCAPVLAPGGFIPWTTFNTKCSDGSGTPYARQAIQSIAVLAPDNDTTATAFNFCLDCLSESGVPTGAGGATGTGGAVRLDGAVGTGGVVATGGAVGTGGVVATGGAVGTGGVVTTGGTTSSGGVDGGTVVKPEAGVSDVPAPTDLPVVSPEAGTADLPPVTTDAPIVTPDTNPPDTICTPVCTSKHCGDNDGCGGKCQGTCVNGLTCCGGTCASLGSDPANCGTCGKSCGADGTCFAGACATCTPDCTGKNCGSDGCGGICHSACSDPANPFCIQGTCQPCTPSCTNAACGDADGCGGRCQGTCATGTCTAGYCSTCTPICIGKGCGDPDGCGGKCTTGTCLGGTCGADGTCGASCVPSCVGKTCGNNGCGGSCNNCVWPEICGDRSVLTTPTWTCIDQSLGCANGARQGYLDPAKYEKIAGCASRSSGAENSGDLRKTRTGKWCGWTAGGNDFGTCDALEDACSPGWHICGRNGAPKDLTDRILLGDCLSSTEANGTDFIAALSPIDPTSDTCCPASTPTSFACPTDLVFEASACGHADPAIFDYASPVTCGADAVQTPSCSDFGGWSGAVPTAVGTGWGGSCGNAATFGNWGGILCCKDPAHTGNN